MFDGKPLTEKGLAYCHLTSTWGPHDGNDGGFVVSYGAKGFGFGNVSFVIKKDGSLVCDSEREDRETVKYILNCLVDRAEFKDSRKGEAEPVANDSSHGNSNREKDRE